MKKGIKKVSCKKKKRKRPSAICLICWIIIPLIIAVMLILDGLGVYAFNTERLLVMGACILVILIPFFSEITIKNVSIKKENNSREQSLSPAKSKNSALVKK